MNKKKLIKEEYKAELKIKQDQLADHKARLNGGFSPILKKEIMSIDNEVARFKKIIRMRELEMQMDTKVNPTFAYETNAEWIEIRRSFEKEEHEKLKKTLTLLAEQKEKVIKEIAELETRIKELEDLSK